MIALLLFVNGASIYVLLFYPGFGISQKPIKEVLFQAGLIVAISLVSYFKPIAALMAVFAVELSLKNFHIGPVSIRTVIVLLLFILYISRRILNDEEIKLKALRDLISNPIIIFSFLFFLWYFITTVFIHDETFSLNITVRVMAAILIAVLCVLLLREEQTVSTFIWVGMAVLAVSGLVAVLQKHVGEPFISLPGLLGETDPSLGKVHISGGRYTGLTDSCTTLAFNMVNVYPLLIAVLWLQPGRKIVKDIGKGSLRKIILSVMFFLVFYALILTGTRSAGYGIIVGLLITMVLVLIRKKNQAGRVIKNIFFYSSLIIVGFLIFNISQVESFKRITQFKDVSVTSKIPRFISGLKEVRGNLLAGTGRAFAEPLENEEEIPRFLRKFSEGLGGGKPHNIFLNALLTGGLPMLILLILFFSAIMVNVYSMLFKIVREEGEKFYFAYFFGYATWIVAYILDKTQHNESPFYSDVLFWFVLGSMLALTKIYKRRTSGRPSRRSGWTPEPSGSER